MSILDAVAASMHHALLIGLNPEMCDEVVFGFDKTTAKTTKTNTGQKLPRRPWEGNCDIHVFSQVWGSTALGFGGVGGQAMTNAWTVVVGGPTGDFCVYFAGRLAYHIEKPNDTFFHDLREQRMHAVAGARRKYDKPADTTTG